MQSQPLKVIIEIGPLIFAGTSKRQIRAMEQQTKRDADVAIRQHLGLGPYSKVVRVRMAEHSESSVLPQE
jgi:hypothetical protein